MKQSDQLFDAVNIAAIPDREFRVLNALNVSIYRCLSKYEVIFQIIDRNETEYNREVVLLCWELVDWLERTRKILGLGAGIKKNDPEYILTYKKLESAEQFRHSLQHFDKYINESNDSSAAPLGSVSAIRMESKDEIMAVVFTPGLVRGSGVDLGNFSMPEKMIDKVDFVTLELNGERLNLSEIARKLLKYYEYIRESTAVKYPKT